MTRFFICYSRKDQDFAQKIADDLINVGVDVWLDQRNILPSDNWGEAIQRGLDTSDIMLLIVSPESMESDNVALEWQYYFDNKKQILPLWLKPAKMQFQISRLQYIDFVTQPYDPAFAQLLRYLGITARIPPTDPPVTAAKTLQATDDVTKKQPPFILYIAAGIGAVILVFAIGIWLNNQNGTANGLNTPTVNIALQNTSQATVSATGVPTRTVTKTVTPRPTLDVKAAAQSTNTAEAQLTASAVTPTTPTFTPTTTPTNTATNTSTEAVSTITTNLDAALPLADSATPIATQQSSTQQTPIPTATGPTPTLIPTPVLPIWDDFMLESAESSKWFTQGSRIVTAKASNGALRFETLDTLNRWMKTQQKIRSVAVLVTLQQASTNGQFFLQVEGSVSYRLMLSCTSLANIPTGSRVTSQTLTGNGCPTTHLLMVTMDGKLAHFSLDGTEISTSVMNGDVTTLLIGLSAGSNADVSTVAIVQRVWVKFAPY